MDRTRIIDCEEKMLTVDRFHRHLEARHSTSLSHGEAKLIPLYIFHSNGSAVS